MGVKNYFLKNRKQNLDKNKNMCYYYLMTNKRTDVAFTNPKCSFHFVPSLDERAQKAYRELIKRYGKTSFEKARFLIPLGGDGTLLTSLNRVAQFRQKNPTSVLKTVYGMNLGTLGAWMNPYMLDCLPERINRAQSFVFKPLSVEIEKENKTIVTGLAFNEVVFSRLSTQVPKIEISVNDQIIGSLKGDGVLCATPQGAKAYYSVAGGTIFPMNSHLLGLQSICAYQTQDGILQPYRFNQLVNDTSTVVFKNVSPHKDRAVQLSCDRTVIKRVVSARIRQNNMLGVLVMKEHQNNLF